MYELISNFEKLTKINLNDIPRKFWGIPSTYENFKNSYDELTSYLRIFVNSALAHY